MLLLLLFAVAVAAVDVAYAFMCRLGIQFNFFAHFFVDFFVGFSAYLFNLCFCFIAPHLATGYEVSFSYFS